MMEYFPAGAFSTPIPRNQFGALEWRRLMALFLDDLELAFIQLRPYSGNGSNGNGWGMMGKARRLADWLWEARP